MLNLNCMTEVWIDDNHTTWSSNILTDDANRSDWVWENCKTLNIGGHEIQKITQTSNMDKKVMSEAVCIYDQIKRNPTDAFHNCKFVQLLQISQGHIVDWGTNDGCNNL